MEYKQGQIIKGTIAISISAILWGFDGVVLTPSLFNLDVSYVVLVLHILPFLVMNIFLFKQYKQLKVFVRQDYITIALVALDRKSDV